jgi:hypothetical protein
VIIGADPDRLREIRSHARFTHRVGVLTDSEAVAREEEW